MNRAERLLTQAAEVWEATAGPDHPSLAACLLMLADVQARQGKQVQAESLARRALSIRESKLGPDHPSTLEAAAALERLLEDDRRGDG